MLKTSSNIIWPTKKTKLPPGFNTLIANFANCSYNDKYSLPYGGSVNIRSMELSGICFADSSRRSPK